MPIKELYGDLAFVKDGEVVYKTKIAKTPDVSFTDYCFIFLEINPYDDTNPAHRTLRYATDSELKPIFYVKKVVLADGTIKTF